MSTSGAKATGCNCYPKFSRDQTLLFLFICATYLLLFRGHPALRPPSVLHDMGCYLNSVYSLVGVTNPPCYSPSHFPGIGFVWLPFALLGRFVGAVSGTDPKAWIVCFSSLGSFVCWAWSLFLLLDISTLLSKGRKSFLGPVGVFIFLMSLPLLNYVVQDALMAHAGELLIGLLCLKTILKGEIYRALFFTVWLTAIRINDAPIFLMLVGSLLDSGKIKVSPKVLWAILGGLGAVFAALGIWIGFVVGYNGAFLDEILARIGWVGTLRTIFSIHYGILWFIPLWAVTFVFSITRLRTLSWTGRGAVCWMAAMFIFFVGHSAYLLEFQNLEDQQIRYFTGTCVAAFFLLHELLPQASLMWKRLCYFSGIYGAVIYTTFVWMRFNPLIFVGIQLGGDSTQKNFFAHNGTSLSLAFRKLIAEPVGTSPVVFSFFSWFGEMSVFDRFGTFRVYALDGIPRLVLTCTTFLVMGIFIYSILKYFKMRKELV